MYVVGNQLFFPNWCCCRGRDEYKDSTLLMSLTNERDVQVFTEFAPALEYAGSEMLEHHSSPRTQLPLGMRAVFEVSTSEDQLGQMRIDRIQRVCLPDPKKSDVWRELNFDTSRSIYEVDYSFEGYVYPLLFTHHINLVFSKKMD